MPIRANADQPVRHRVRHRVPGRVQQRGEQDDGHHGGRDPRHDRPIVRSPAGDRTVAGCRPPERRWRSSASSPSACSTRDDPRRRPRDHARGHRARRAARLRQRLGPPPAPAVRHLLAGRGPRRRHAAHQPDRARHRRHPARLGEPAAAGRGPRHRRRALRRPAQPRRQRRPADALGRRQGRALPGHRRRRGLQLRAGRAAAAARRAASRPAPSAGTEGIEEFSDRVQPHSPGLRAPALVRRRQPALGRGGPASTA